jgi:hypothetical protein
MQLLFVSHNDANKIVDIGLRKRVNDLIDKIDNMYHVCHRDSEEINEFMDNNRGKTYDDFNGLINNDKLCPYCENKLITNDDFTKDCVKCRYKYELKPNTTQHMKKPLIIDENIIEVEKKN